MKPAGLLFKSIVRPTLVGNIILQPLYKRDGEKLESVQRRGTKLVPCLKDLPFCERLKSHDLPSLTFRRGRGDMIETYKYTHGLCNTVNSWLSFGHDSVIRSHNLKLVKYRFNSKVRTYSFSNRIMNSWNSILPSYVVKATTLNQFKNNIDNHCVAKFPLSGIWRTAIKAARARCWEPVQRLASS